MSTALPDEPRLLVAPADGLGGSPFRTAPVRPLPPKPLPVRAPEPAAARTAALELAYTDEAGVFAVHQALQRVAVLASRERDRLTLTVGTARHTARREGASWHARIDATRHLLVDLDRRTVRASGLNQELAIRGDARAGHARYAILCGTTVLASVTIARTSKHPASGVFHAAFGLAEQALLMGVFLVSSPPRQPAVADDTWSLWDLLNLL